MLAALQARRVLLTGSSAKVVYRSSKVLPSCWHRSFHFTASKRSNLEKVDLSSPKNDYIGLKLSSNASIQRIPSNDLEVYPNFLTPDEQQVLLTAALKKLDSMASRDERKRRRDWTKANKGKAASSELKSFLPDEVYDFEKQHFDGVISGYRESTLSEWMPFESPGLNDTLASVLQRTYSLLLGCDFQSENPLQTPSKLLAHLLHLSSNGYILPHVDNIEASAGTILGICLGSQRYLVLTSTEAGHTEDQIRVRLPPGCAYIQRGQIRYKWKHEIPAADPADPAQAGQRLSVMIRDRLSQDAS